MFRNILSRSLHARRALCALAIAGMLAHVFHGLLALPVTHWHGTENHHHAHGGIAHNHPHPASPTHTHADHGSNHAHAPAHSSPQLPNSPYPFDTPKAPAAPTTTRPDGPPHAPAPEAPAPVETGDYFCPLLLDWTNDVPDTPCLIDSPPRVHVAYSHTLTLRPQQAPHPIRGPPSLGA